MTGKMGLLIGLMVGFVMAVASSVTTMILVSSEVQSREAKAYEAGMADGTGAAKVGQGKVSDVLNRGLMQENADRAQRAEEAKGKLSELLALPGLPDQARTKAQEAVDALGQ